MQRSPLVGRYFYSPKPILTLEGAAYRYGYVAARAESNLYLVDVLDADGRKLQPQVTISSGVMHGFMWDVLPSQNGGAR